MLTLSSSPQIYHNSSNPNSFHSLYIIDSPKKPFIQPKPNAKMMVWIVIWIQISVILHLRNLFKRKRDDKTKVCDDKIKFCEHKSEFCVCKSKFCEHKSDFCDHKFGFCEHKSGFCVCKSEFCVHKTWFYHLFLSVLRLFFFWCLLDSSKHDLWLFKLWNKK